MAPKLYMLPPSPAVRAVLLCANALGVDLEMITVNLLTGEHLTPEYLKVNYEMCVMFTLNDKIIDTSEIFSFRCIIPRLQNA